MPLRPYQKQLINLASSAMRHHHYGVMLQLMTGGGKTYLTCDLMRTAWHKGNWRSLVIVHRKELLPQWVEEAANQGIRMGVVASGLKNPYPDAMIQVAMVDTLNNRPALFPDGVQLLVIDEAHLGGANRYIRIIERFPMARRIGLTATPDALHGKGFPWATKLIEGPTYEQLQADKALCDFTLYSIPGFDFAGLRVRAGEFTAQSQVKQWETQKLVGNIVDTYMQLGRDRPFIGFMSGRAHSALVAEEFRAVGKRCEHIDGSMGIKEREAIMKAFRAGYLDGITNVNICVEGLNVPRVSYIALGLATASVCRFRQMGGRGLRPDEGKDDCIIADHGGNALRHGNLDYDYKWDIKPRVKGKKSDEELNLRARHCPVCALVFEPGLPACPACGEAMAAAERVVKTKDGQLVPAPKKAAPIARLSNRPNVTALKEEMDVWARRFA